MDDLTPPHWGCDCIESQNKIEELEEKLRLGNGVYQVSLADQAEARSNVRQLIGTIETLLRKHEAYHNSIEHAAARQLLRKIRGEA